MALKRTAITLGVAATFAAEPVIEGLTHRGQDGQSIGPTAPAIQPWQAQHSPLPHSHEEQREIVFLSQPGVISTSSMTAQPKYYLSSDGVTYVGRRG